MNPEEILEGLKTLEYVPKANFFICHDPDTPEVQAALEKMDDQAQRLTIPFGRNRSKHWVLYVPGGVDMDYTHSHNQDTVIYYPNEVNRIEIGAHGMMRVPKGSTLPIMHGSIHSVPVHDEDRYTVVALYD